MKEMSFSKKRKFVFILVTMVILLLACGKSIQKQKMTHRVSADTQNINLETCEDEGIKPYEEKLGNGNVIPYYVPLEEIAQKIEYLYAYQNMLYGQAYDNGELGPLPEGRDICLDIYAAEGNKLLFLPKGRGNREVLVNGEFCSLYYSEERAGYLFYYVTDFFTEEGGIPVNFIGGDYDGWWIRTCIVGGESQPTEDDRFYYGIDSGSLVWLGDAEVEFDPLKKLELPMIPVEGNEYMEAMVRTAKSILAERGKFGEYEMYLGTYGRMPDEMNQYYEIDSSVFVTSGCISGEDLEQYFLFNIWDDQVVGWAHLLCPPKNPESEELFMGDYLLVVNPKESIRRVKDMEWIKIPFTVVKGEEYHVDSNGVELGEKKQNSAEGMDFRTMNSREAADLIAYACSYSEWFGMNELGYKEGEIRGFRGKEIIMYTESCEGDVLLFIPKDMVNRVYEGEDGEKYSMYVNEEGYAEFYCMRLNPYAGEQGDLKTTLCTTEKYREDSISGLSMIGRERLEIKELQLFDLPEVKDDGYVEALEEYVKKLLEQSGEPGKYEVYIGEYEVIYPSRICISAAVVGEKEYYVRYLVVRSQHGKYYFWPTGFGLDWSMEECEAGRHYMNGLCIERTKRLGRHVSEMEVGKR